VDRTHELTGARYDPATGLLNSAATGTLVPFPSYLIGTRYVANANDNRNAGTDAASNDYRVTYTIDGPGRAYLLLDNRINGTTGTVDKTNTTDPILTGSLAWVGAEGWQRLNTGIMPNGQGDYIGIDEGGTVAGPNDRTHHDPGAGAGLNNFFSIYYKDFLSAGSFTTNGEKVATSGGNMYVVAVGPIPEPSMLALAGVAAIGLMRRGRKA
jgi:hypothetical protein